MAGWGEGWVLTASLCVAVACASSGGSNGAQTEEAREGGPSPVPSNTAEHACDPLAPPAITLGAVVGVGKDAAGTLYVDAANGIFVSTAGELVRQHVIGSGSGGSNEFLYTFEAPGSDVSSAHNLLVETQAGAATAMALGPLNSKAFLNESPAGTTPLTLVDASAVAGMNVVNTPNVVTYVATAANGDVLLAVSPMNSSDSGASSLGSTAEEDGGLRIFYGVPAAVAERPITAFEQSVSGDGTLTFLVERTPYVLEFGMVPAPDAGPLGVFTLKGLTPEGGPTIAVSLQSPTPDAPPAGWSFTCLPSG